MQLANASKKNKKLSSLKQQTDTAGATRSRRRQQKRTKAEMTGGKRKRLYSTTAKQPR